MGVSKVEVMENGNPRTLIDLTGDSVTPQTLAAGTTAHNAEGEQIEGELPTTNVLYTPQKLTDEQQAQARTNIGASNNNYDLAFWCEYPFSVESCKHLYMYEDNKVNDVLRKVLNNEPVKIGLVYFEGGQTADAVYVYVDGEDELFRIVFEVIDSYTEEKFRVLVKLEASELVNGYDYKLKNVDVKRYSLNGDYDLVFHCDDYFYKESLADIFLKDDGHNNISKVHQKIMNNEEVNIVLRTAESSYQHEECKAVYTYADGGCLFVGFMLMDTDSNIPLYLIASFSEESINSTNYVGKPEYITCDTIAFGDLVGEIKEEVRQVQASIADQQKNIASYETLTLGVNPDDGLIYLYKSGNPIGTGVEVDAKGDVIGYIDSENNIVLSGALADGTYTVKYEMEDGTVIDIGNMELGAVVEIINVLPLSVDASGNPYVGTNGEKGYKRGYKLSSSSGNEGAVSATTACVSGFIKLPEGKQSEIRIKDVTLSNYTGGTINNICFYKADKTLQKGTGGTSGAFDTKVSVSNGVYLIETKNWFTIDNLPVYMRFSCGEITDETIVTIDQEIV